MTSASLLLGALTPTLAYAVDPDAPTFDADVNQDGKVDQNDVQKILDIIAGFTKTISAEDGYEVYDANHNGFVDPADALAVSQYVDGSRKSLPAPYGTFLDNSIGLSCTDASCFIDETASVQFSIVDWNKDIAAYDFIFHADPGLEIESVNCNGNARSVIKNNTVRIFGLGTDLELNRGKIASIQLSPPAEGDFRLSLDASNIYASNLDYYPSKNPQAIVSCYAVFAPVALEAAGVSSKSACISWEMPFSDSPVTGFAVYRNQEYLADTVETIFYDTDLDPDTEYTYTVCAYNQNGNQTDFSEPLTIKTAAPVITGASFPAEAVSYTNSRLSIEFEREALLSALQFDFSTDGKIVHSEKLELDGKGMKSLTQQINTAPLSSGDYLLTITATDIDGQSDTHTMNVSIRNDRPAALTLTAHPGSESVTLTWNIAPEPDVVAYHVYRQAPDEKEPTLLQVISDREKLDFTDTMLDANAKYTYGVTAVNSYGAESERSNLETVQPDPDTTAPQITLLFPKTGSTAHQTQNIRVEATDNSRMGRVECHISADEGKTWELLFAEEGGSGIWALDTTKYPDGIYHLKAAAYDASGNECPDTYINIVKFDNTAPETIENIHLVELYPTTATIGWDNVAAQDFSKFLFTLSYGNTTKTYTVNNKLGITLENLKPGQLYSATVAAIDQCGNVGQTSEPFCFETPADITAPVITELRIPGTVRNGGEFQLRIAASDVSKIKTYYFEYSQDLVEWKPLLRYSEEFIWKPSGLTEGILYVRAYAEDIYHNIGNPETAKITEIIVDNTAPQTLPTLSAQSADNGIELSWNYIEDEPGQSFILQRSTFKNFTSYKTILEYYTRNNCTDTDTTSGKTYYYRIAVADEVGNISSFSDPIAVQREKDKICPEITDFYFSNSKYVLCSDFRTVQFMAKDNEYLERIEVSYALDGSDSWTKLSGEIQTSSDSRQLLIRIELPESVLEADTVTLRAIAYDHESNPSETYEAVFTVDHNPIFVENLTVTQVNGEVIVSWDCSDLEEIRSFSVERSINDGHYYSIQSNIKPDPTQTSYSISDNRLEYSGSYVYRVLVNKTNLIVNETTAEPVEIQGIPRPSLVCDTAQTLGAAYYFDATGSAYADEITSLILDYGDGTTDTASEVSAAKFQHTYAEAGTYTATLTCTNAAGISRSTTAKITVEDASQLAKVQLQVKTSDGAKAANISVYMDVGTDQQMQYETDQNGTVSFYASEGNHEIGVFGNNYLPATKTVSLIAGAENKVEFTVVRDQLVDAKFEITRMTLEEIKAAGIDVEDPENINIVKVDIRLKYEQNIEDSPSRNLSFLYDNNSGTYHLPAAMTSQGYSIQAVKTNSYTHQIETIALLHIPPEVHSLKEFFNVKMIVINNADTSFTLEDCTATIHTPKGLTLMEENASPRTVSLGNIAGQSSAEVNWILRGDVEGEYHISAGFQAVLSKFNQPVSYIFDAEQTIEVLGKKALDITISIHPVVKNNCTYAEILMKNIADFPIYQVGAKIEDGTLVIVHGDNNTSKAVICESAHYDTRKVWTKLDGNPEMIETLLPGEIFSLVFRISNKSENFKKESFERIKGSLEAIMPDGAQITTKVSSVGFLDVDSIFYGIPFDAETQYLFAIRNKAHKELADAAVTVYTVTEDNEKIVYAAGLTDERGRFIVPRGIKEQKYYIEVTAEGYRKYYEPHFFFSPNQYSSTFTLTGDFLEYDYKLQSASIATVKTCYADILRKQYAILDDVEDEFKISVVGVEGITKFELRQPDRFIASCKANSYYGGTFESLHAAYFDVGQPIYVEAYLETGDYIKTMLGLKIMENPKRQTNYLKKQMEDLLDNEPNVSFKVPKETPMVGGVDMTIDLEKLCDLPIEVEFSFGDAQYIDDNYEIIYDKSVDVSIAVNLKDLKDDKEEESKKFNADEWRRQIDEAKKNVKALRKHPIPRFSLKSDSDDGKSTNAKSELCFAMLFSGSYDLKEKSLSGDIDFALMYELSGEIASFNTYVGPIPVYGAFEGSIGAQIGTNISYNTEKGFDFTLFKLGAFFELSGKACVGLSYGDFSAGLGGKVIAGGEVSTSLLPLELLEVTAHFEGGLVADFIIGEYYVELGGGDLILYSSDPPEHVRPESSGGGGGHSRALTRSQLLALGFSEKDIDAGIKQVSVSSPSSVWNGNWTDTQPLNQLASHTAATLPQKLVSFGDTAMLIWNARDNERGGYNSKYLVYAIYDKENGCWSEPKPIDSNQQSEIISSVIETPQGIYLAYLEADRVYEADEAIDIPDYFNRLTLKTARYDAQTDSFTDHTAIPLQSDSHSFSNAQFVTDANGTTYLFWNESNDEQLSSLCYATRTETGWSEPTVLLDEIPGLSALACTTSTSGKPVAAYLSNPDADTVKFDYAQLTICDMDGTTSVLDEGSIGGLTTGALPQGGTGVMWVREGKLFASADLSTPVLLYQHTEPLMSDDYTVSGDQVFFTALSSESAQILSASYNPETKTLNAPVVISEADDSSFYSPQAITLDNQTIYTLESLQQNDTEHEFPVTNLLLGGTIPERTDLTLSNLSYEIADAAAGKPLKIGLDIQNNGTTSISGLKAALVDAAGNEYAAIEYSETLLPGEAKTLEYVPQLPDDCMTNSYQVRISTVSEDANPDDNLISIPIAATDFSIESTVEYLDDLTTVSILVKNNGQLPSQAMVLASNSSGETLRMLTDMIDPGASIFYTFDGKELLGDAYRDFVTLTVQPEMQDYDTYNNKTTVILSQLGMNDEVMGDIDFNGVIDSDDSNLILKQYLSDLVGTDALLSQTQIYLSDINNDKTINADDANLVLLYYLETMLDNTYDSISDFYESLQKGGSGE